jgi:hypothetical protein
VVERKTTLVQALRLTLVVAIASLVFFHFYTLMIFPDPFLDEAWFMARAQGFVKHGYSFGALDVGVFDRLPGHQYFFPYLPTVFQAIPYLFLEEPSLYATRLVSLLFGMILASCMFLIGRWVAGTTAGLLSALLVVSTPWFLLSGHLARIDVQAAAVGFLGLTLVLTNDAQSRMRFLLGGFLAGLAFELHAHAAVITATALAAALHHGPSIRRRSSSVLFTGLGCSVGGLVFLILHVFPAPSAYRDIQRIAFAPTHLPPVVTGDSTIILEGLYQAGQAVLHHGIASLALVWSLVVGAMFVTTGRLRSISMLAGLALVLFGLLIRNKIAYYYVLFEPLLFVLWASLIVHLCREVDGWNLPRKIVGRVVQAGAVGLAIAFMSTPVRLSASIARDEKKAVSLPSLSGVIGPEDVILGTQTYWLSAVNNRYYSPEHLVYYTRWKPGFSVSDALKDFAPTVIIEDDHLRSFLKTTNPAECYYICLPDDGLATLIASSELVAEIPSPNQGLIRIYRPRRTP